MPLKVRAAKKAGVSDATEQSAMTGTTTVANTLGVAPPIRERLSFQVHKISARIALLGSRHFREHGLNHFSARMLVLLLESGELKTGELVDLMLLPQSTISTQLLALHKRRLIRRRRSRLDNRSVIVSLTQTGLELARDCNDFSVRTNYAMLRDISEHDKKIADSFFRTINERLAELEEQEMLAPRKSELAQT